MRRYLRQFSRSKFIRDTLTLQASKISTTLLGLVAWVVTVRLMGFEQYGVWGLTLSYFAIWQAFDLSGIGTSTSTRLSIAIGGQDAAEIRNLMAFYVKVNVVWAVITAAFMLVIAPSIARQWYGDDTRVGALAAGYAFTLGADALYTLVILALQSRRLMRELAVLQNANQVVLFACVVVAMLVRPTPESMVIARLVYSYGTMLMAFAVYERLKTRGGLAFPPLSAVFRRAVSVSPRPYWRSSVAMALDKNVSNLYTQAPVTLVGIMSGETAAGYLRTALDGINRSALLTSAVMDNMQAVVPQAVGRKDYAGLRRNFNRVLFGMAALGAGFYALLALLAPLFLPLLLGGDSLPAVPVFMALAVYGAVTAVGGIFGPLYRAFEMLGAALVVKLIATIIILPPGLLLIQTSGALGGAWTINGLFALSIALTIAVTLPELRRRARVESLP